MRMGKPHAQGLGEGPYCPELILLPTTTPENADRKGGKGREVRANTPPTTTGFPLPLWHFKSSDSNRQFLKLNEIWQVP